MNDSTNPFLVAVLAACLMLCENPATADEVKTLGRSNHFRLLASLFDDQIVAGNVTVARKHAAGLPEAERFDWLVDWVLPSASHSMIGMRGVFTQTDPALVNEFASELVDIHGGVLDDSAFKGWSAGTSDLVVAFTEKCRIEGQMLHEGWGTIEDPMAGAKIVLNDSTLVMIAPNAYRDNVPGRKFNAPRVMQAASGDFTVGVKVTHVDEAKPNSVLKSLGGFSTAYHAGTLLVRGDNKNAIRFDCVSMNTDGQLTTAYVLQVYEDGKMTGYVSEKIEDATIQLVLKRQGNMLQSSFSLDDGKTWKELRQHELKNLTGPVQVGVSLTSNTDPGCMVKFQDLKLVTE